MSWLLVVLLIVFVLAPVAQAFAKRLGTPESPALKPADVARLREELDQLAAQVNRLQDEQSFMLKLLGEGQEEPPLLEAERRPDLPDRPDGPDARPEP